MNRLIIDRIHIRGLRAHNDSTVTFDAGVNAIVGPNGVGKTNILEAIHMLCLSRSFLTSKDNVILRRGSSLMEIEGHFTKDAGGSQKVRLAFVPGEGKKLFVGGSPLERMTDLVGRFPVVVFSPDDQRLTAEGPEFRRRFMDNIISQSSPVYLDNLLRYRQVLKQRNELLHASRRARRTPDEMVLESLTRELVMPGAAIIADRMAFIEAFAKHLDDAHQKISEVAEKPGIAYAPFGRAGIPEADIDSEDGSFPKGGITIPNESREQRARREKRVFELYADQLERNRRHEIARGMTLYGPHRHELDLTLDGHPVRRFASQGQHRTYGMALKLAQYDYMQHRREERPLLLLDDVFDNLDPARIEAFLAILGSDAIGQSITTAARREIVHNHLDPSACRTIFVARGGEVLEDETSIEKVPPKATAPREEPASPLADSLTND